jgi:hypothetical protein
MKHDPYDELYALFKRRYHPAIAAILAHEYAVDRRPHGNRSLPQQLQREATR